MDTSCKDCCFAEYDKNTQIDCNLDKLSKFRKANIEILEAYDNEKEFFVIKSKTCVCHRTKEWAKLYSDKILEKLKEETKLKCDVIVYLDSKNTKYDLEKTISSINYSEITANKVIIINNKANIKPSEIQTIANINFTNKWTLEIIIEENLDRKDCLSLITNRLNGQYFIFINAGIYLNHNLISNINFYINDLMKILLLSGDLNYILIAQKVMFKLCNNNIKFMEKECNKQSQKIPLKVLMT
jgi:hypothetical protein